MAPTIMSEHQPLNKKGKFYFDRWWILFFFIIAVIVLLVYIKPDPFRRILFFVSDGIGVTVYTTLISFFLVLVFGLITGIGRLSKNFLINGVSTIYVELV